MFMEKENPHNFFRFSFKATLHTYFDSVESSNWISVWICSQIQFLANAKAKAELFDPPRPLGELRR